MLLQDLPVDLLSDVLRGSSSSQSLALLKCGNKQLTIKLYNGGARELDLADGWLHSASRWPKCALYFKLESLRISKLNGTVGSTLMVRQALSSMHHGLKHLTLEFSSALRAVMDGETNILSRFKSLSSLRLYSSETSQFALSIDSIAKLPSSLTRLDIDAPVNSFSWRWREEIKVLKETLPNLSFLRLGKATITDAGLLSLEGCQITDFGDSLDGTAITLLAREKKQREEEEKERGREQERGRELSSSSSSSSLPQSSSSLPASQSSSSSLPSWPRLVPPSNFSYLHISNISPLLHLLNGWPSFTTVIKDRRSLMWNWPWPSALAVLHLGDSYTLDASSLATIPSTVSDLRASIAWEQVTHTTWPKSLTSLELIPNDSFNYHCFPLLPRRLLSLHASLFFELTEDFDEENADQPQDHAAIASLLQQGIHTLSSLDAQDWSLIKTQAGYVSSSKKKHQDSDKFDQFDEISSQKRNLVEIEKGLLLGLPLSLTHLSLSSSKSAYVSAWGALPPKLKHARIGSFSKLLALPPSLETLELEYEHLLLIEAKEELQHAFLEREDKALKYLTKLKHFRISFSEAADSAWGVYPTFTGTLPHEALERLQIEYRGEVYANVFRFPEASLLRSLLVDVKREIPKPSIWMKWLPSTLRDLELGGGCKSLKGESLAFLPPSLTSLTLFSLTDFSPSHLLSTHPALAKINLVKIGLEHPNQIAALIEHVTPIVTAWKMERSMVEQEEALKALEVVVEDGKAGNKMISSFDCPSIPLLAPEVWLLGLIRHVTNHFNYGALTPLVAMVHDLLDTHCRSFPIDPRVLARTRLL